MCALLRDPDDAVSKSGILEIGFDSSDAKAGEMETILRFCRGIAAAGFHEESLCELLQLADVPLLRPHHIPGYIERCRQDNSQRAFLTCLWLLTLHVHKPEAVEIMGRGMVTELIQRGYLVETPGERLKAGVDLYPCLGVSVFTDPVFAPEFRADHVYQLGTDSYVLARVTPRKPSRRALDLCTGSGVQALLSAGHHQEVVGVDLNPRALEFARYNSFLNRLDDRCSFVRGDLYEPVQGERFDLITANPPFVPTPEREISLHRGVGETGEEIPRRIVAGLPDFLEPGGTLSMVLDYPMIQGSSYLGRLCQWISGAESEVAGVVPGWGVAVVHFLTESCSDYIRNHVDGSVGQDYYRVAREYLESYQRLGIQSMGFANVFIRRLPANHPGYAVMRSMPIPIAKISDVIEQWLSHLQMIHDPDWVPQRPMRLAPRVKDFWVGQLGGTVRFEFVDESWSLGLEADASTLELVRLIKNERLTLGQLLVALKQHPPAAVRQRLDWLLANLLIELV